MAGTFPVQHKANRWLQAILSTVLAVCLVACGSGNDNTPTGEAEPTEDGSEVKETFSPPMPSSRELNSQDFDHEKYEREKAEADKRVLTYLLRFIEENPGALMTEVVFYMGRVPDEWKDVAIEHEKGSGIWRVRNAVPLSRIDTDYVRKVKVSYTEGLGIVECKVPYEHVLTTGGGDCIIDFVVIWDVEKGKFRTKGLISEQTMRHPRSPAEDTDESETVEGPRRTDTAEVSEPGPSIEEVHDAVVGAAEEKYKNLCDELRKRLKEDERVVLDQPVDVAESESLDKLKEIAQTKLQTALDAMDEHRKWVRERHVVIEAPIRKAEQVQRVKANKERADIYTIMIFKPTGGDGVFQGKDEYAEQWVVVETTEQAPKKYDDIDRYEALSGRFKRAGSVRGTNSFGAEVEHPRYIDPPTTEQKRLGTLKQRREEIRSKANKAINNVFKEAAAPAVEGFASMLDRAVELVREGLEQTLESALESLRAGPTVVEEDSFASSIESMTLEREGVQVLADAMADALASIEAHIDNSRTTLADAVKAFDESVQGFCDSLDLWGHPLAEGHDILEVARQLDGATRMQKFEDEVAALQPEWRSKVVGPVENRLADLVESVETGRVLKGSYIAALRELDGKLLCLSIDDSLRHFHFSLFDGDAKVSSVSAAVGRHSRSFLQQGQPLSNVSIVDKGDDHFYCHVPADREVLAVARDCTELVLRVNEGGALVVGKGGLASFEPTFEGSKKYVMKFVDERGEGIVSAHSVTAWEKRGDKLYAVDGPAGMESVHVLNLKTGAADKYAAPRQPNIERKEREARKKGRRLPADIRDAFDKQSPGIDMESKRPESPTVTVDEVVFDDRSGGKLTSVYQVQVAGDEWRHWWVLDGGKEQVRNELVASARYGQVLKIGSRVYFGLNGLRWYEVD